MPEAQETAIKDDNIMVDLDTTGKSVDVELKDAKQEEVVDQKIIISGKTYSSREAAMEQLKFFPQSRLTEEEIKFVESY